MSKKSQKNKQKPIVEFDENSMNVGGIKFTNLNLQDIVKKSGIEGKDMSTPEFQKMLDEFATQESKAIMDSAVKTLPPVALEEDHAPSPSPTAAGASQYFWNLEDEEPQYFEPPKPDPELQFRPYLSNAKYWEDFNRRVEECNRDAYRKEDIARLKKESLVKPRRSLAAPAAPKTNFFRKQKTHRLFGGKYVNPNGMDSHYYDVPENPEMKRYYDSDDIEHDVVRDKRYPPFEESKLVFKETLDIAKRVLNIDFRFSFVFHMDIMIGLSGIRRHLSFYMTGHDTYTDLEAQLRHQYTEGENFQLFYMNFDGQYMEIHDNLTLKQALITHGAYPRGAYCRLHNVRAKFWMIPSTKSTEEFIFEREKDMIMAADAHLADRQDDAVAEQLAFFLSPELNFETVYYDVIHYTDAEYARPYNKFTNTFELHYECQRVRTVEDLFKDTRTKKIDKFQIMECLKDRYSAPYNGMSSDDSVHRDYLIIMDGLRKSNHQTKEALQEIEGIMKKDMAEWKAKEAEKRARMPVQMMRLPSGFSGPHTVQHIPNPLMKAEPPMTLSQIMETSDYKPAYVNLAPGYNYNDPSNDEFPSIISKLKHDSENLQSNVKNLIEERDGYVGKDDIEIEEIPGSSTTIRIGESFRSPAPRRDEVFNPMIINTITGLLNPPNKYAQSDHLRHLQKEQHKEDKRVKDHMNRVINQMNREEDPTAAQIAQGLSWNTSDLPVRVPTRNSAFSSHRDTVVTTSADDFALDEDKPPPPPSVPPPPLEEVDPDSVILPEELAELGYMGVGMEMMSPFARLAASQEQQINVIPLGPNSGITQMDAILAAMQIDPPDVNSINALSAVVDKNRLDGHQVIQPSIAKYITRDTVNFTPTGAFVPPAQYTFTPPTELGEERAKHSNSKKND